MAWVRMSGGSNTGNVLKFPPSKGWIIGNVGTYSVADNELSVTSVPLMNYGTFTKTFKPKSYARTFSVTANSDDYFNLRVDVNGAITELYSGAPTTITRTFTVPANVDTVTLSFYEAWSSSVSKWKHITDVHEV